MTNWIDGRFVADSSLPKRKGIAPFETMGAEGGEVPLWRHHLARLSTTTQRLGLPFVPGPELPAAARELLVHNDHRDAVLRLAVVPHAAGTAVVMTSRPRSPIKVVQLLPTVVARPADAPPGDVKAEPRGYYDAIRQQAQDGGADDGIVVVEDGVVLETALGNLWLRLDGRWVTPALDGRVLPGVARTLLLAAARRVGKPIEERRLDLADLHRAEALAHSNAVHGVRPACLCGTAPAVALVDSELQPLWSAARSS
ncbi:MAG: aminotransferase class IV [Planctomycetes bacterium]|jgi:branched-subunit amino acid aminotransferase/4-amino-4-deoxychorismate lyase|nr:aminotransferase class IV [Planctomycetota bacterium]